MGFNQRTFAEGLRVGVGVGPSERSGTGTAGFDHAIRDPAIAELFGLLSK
ncbi:unannotated protein [freshwater metagenome]|uniref:Unannotated protein n=1 Tax=freshwater metagenome TaxID=449393 RepID=A0A6J6I007_9ZZZZ